MARFFKYKSTADLLAENARLGLDLRFSDELSAMDVPLKIGSRTASNRWCVHPMEGCDGELDGAPGELTFRRYHRFASGGAKVIWGEACAVTDEGRANPRQIWLNDNTRSVFAKLVQEARAFHRVNFGRIDDLLFGLQLTHSGRYCHSGPRLAAADPLLVGRYDVAPRHTAHDRR